MLEELIHDGYDYFIDPLDAEIAAQYPCEQCGGHNVYGDGVRRHGSYRAFAICPDCGHEAEF